MVPIIEKRLPNYRVNERGKQPMNSMNIIKSGMDFGRLGYVSLQTHLSNYALYNEVQ